MATPNYLGAPQVNADHSVGLLARLGSYFGGSTPAYAGEGQPSSTSASGLFKGTTPVYASAPVALDAQDECAAAAEGTTEASCPIDPDALAAGHIAIVIPRNG